MYTLVPDLGTDVLEDVRPKKTVRRSEDLIG